MVEGFMINNHEAFSLYPCLGTETNIVHDPRRGKPERKGHPHSDDTQVHDEGKEVTGR